MFNLFCLLILIILEANLFAGFEDVKINSQTGIKFLSVNSEQNSSVYSEFNPSINLNYEFKKDSLDLFINGGAFFRYGSGYNFVLEDFSPKNELYIDDAFIRYGFKKSTFNLVFDAGVLDQTESNNLFCGDHSFSSISQQLKYRRGPFNYEIKLVQSILSNSFTTTRPVTIESKVPYFITEKLLIGFQNKNSYEFDLSLMHYKFIDLKDIHHVAYDSKFTGNSVTGQTQENSSFIYDYEGYGTNLHINLFKNSIFNYDTNITYIYNDKAPDSRNKGFKVKNEVSLIYTKNLVSLYHEYYLAKSDVFPGYYSNNNFGYVNRDAHSVGTKFYRKDINLTLNLNYIYSKPNKSNTYQSNLKLFIFNLTKGF